MRNSEEASSLRFLPLSLLFSFGRFTVETSLFLRFLALVTAVWTRRFYFLTLNLFKNLLTFSNIMLSQ